MNRENLAWTTSLGRENSLRSSGSPELVGELASAKFPQSSGRPHREEDNV
jgi:hypothetical protein